GAWEKIDDFTGLFAPGGDFLTYTRAAENVVRHAPETRSTAIGEISFTRYTFDINGRRYAEQMRGQLKDQAVREGLPPGMQMELPRVYVDMTGTGELWVGADGLPLRQQFSLTFPETKDNYVTTAEIAVDFKEFAPLPPTALVGRIGRNVDGALQEVVDPHNYLLLPLAALFLFCIAILILRSHSRHVYRIAAVSIVIAMVAGPFLTSNQVYAYGSRQLAKQKEQEARQEEVNGQQNLQDQLSEPSFDPNRDPLEVARQKAALTGPEQIIVATGDNERYYDDRCASDPNGDIDNDKLTNLEECLLGTLIDDEDSDEDGASDYHEVTGVNYNGVMWYTDPVILDSNNDGIGDGKEWFTDPDNNGSPVLDTDGDGRPDVWDEDNDGDGVMDRLDLSPYMSTGPGSAAPKSFTEQSPLDLTMNHLVQDELVKVEFQIRTDNPDHLWYSQNILDWPEGDLRGNIQDADGKTFYDIDNTTSPSPNDNGDMRMVPLLEITFNNADANLPPAETCQDDDGNDYTCYPILEDFAISVSRVDDNTSVAYVPLQLVQDATGDANVAFYGRMLYQASGSWGTPHQVRMAWAVQALVDVCSEYEYGSCTAYEKYNDIQLVHIYYDDFHLTGLHMTEDHSANMALVYEDPTQTTSLTNQDKPFYLDVLNGLLYGLDKSFLAGRCAPTEADGSCAPNATRDMTVDEIYRRFNHATNSGVSDTERWNLPNVLTVVKNEYDSLDLGLLDLTTVQTEKILDDHFTSAWSAGSPISPTIMVTYEEVYRDLNLDQEIAAGQTHVNWQGNKLTLDMPQSGANEVKTDTMASVKWTPYAYDPASGWAAADIQEFWLTLEKEWGPIFEGSPDPDTYQTYGQYLYLAIYNGSSKIVQTGDVIYPGDYQQLDPNVAQTLTIQGLSYTFAALKSLLNASAENEEQLAQLAQFLQEIGFPDSKIPQKAAQKALVFYSELGETSYVMVVTFMAVLAIVVAVSLILYLTIHNTGVNWTLAISVGLLMLVFTVIKPVLEYIQFVRSIMATSETIGFGNALWRSISELNTITEGAKFFATMGLILEIGVAVGFFIQAWADGSAKPGSIAFNEAVAITIATIFVAVLLFVIGSFLLGGLIIGIISLIDSVLKLAGVNWSITGALTKALASVIYQYNIYTEQDSQTGTLANELTDPAAGLTAGNHFSFTLPITTTLTKASGLVHPDSTPSIKRNSLIYQLGAQGVALSTSRDARVSEWAGSNNKVTVTDFPSTQVELQAGINAQLPLYLNTGYALGAQSCWVGFCSDKTISGSSIAFLGSEMYFDVFPPTLQEFLDLSVSGWSRGRLRAVDKDGDGLLAAAYGGLDPDDANWDSDGDGLSDGYELTIRAKAPTEGGLNLNPLNPDGDSDFITDGDELLYGTNPDNEDSDGDGILDIEEIPYIVDVNGKVNMGGWDLPYAPQKTTRTWGDPLTDDADGDGLSDLFERSQDTCPTCTPWTDPKNPAVYHPNVWNQSPVNLFIEDGSSDGFVAPGETINYTTTTENNLGQGQELIGNLSLELPDNFTLTGGNLEQAVDITSGSSQSLESTINAINASTSISGTLISTMRLSNFETTAWSWDPPQPGSTAAAASIQDLVAVPVFGWEEPSLLIAREVAGDGTQSLVGYLADPNGLAGDPQPLYSVSGGETLTAPAVACKDDGTCMVIFGINSGSAPGIVRSMTLYKGLSEKTPNQFIWAAGQATTLDIQSTAVAGDETGFLAGWSTADGNAHVQYVDNVGLPGEEGVKQLATGAADVTLSLAGSGYLAGWTQAGSLRRADITVVPPTVTINNPQDIGPGSGWPQGAPPRQVYDPISRQALLLYRDANARLQARRLTAGISDPLEINQKAGDDLSGNGVQTALCADTKNGGWVAAWSSPNDNLTYYQA
ncbi:MAG: hypothetical protein R3293_24255, partial [Candidatus Promineifilaceae bacterium]|nr:hypothetical protein [Candidatus Promineifilaceae bacterium]